MKRKICNHRAFQDVFATMYVLKVYNKYKDSSMTTLLEHSEANKDFFPKNSIP